MIGWDDWRWTLLNAVDNESNFPICVSCYFSYFRYFFIFLLFNYSSPSSSPSLLFLSGVSFYFPFNFPWCFGWWTFGILIPQLINKEIVLSCLSSSSVLCGFHWNEAKEYSFYWSLAYTLTTSVAPRLGPPRSFSSTLQEALLGREYPPQRAAWSCFLTVAPSCSHCVSCGIQFRSRPPRTHPCPLFACGCCGRE